VQKDYIDIDVYVEEDDGSEWNFSIFKDMGDGRICFGGYQWAATKDASFDDTDKEPSVLVWVAVLQEMPHALKLVEEQPMAFIGDLVEEDIQKALKGA